MEMASSQPLTFQRRSLQLAISCARAVQNLTVRVGWAQAFATSALMTSNCLLPQTGCGFSSPSPGNALQAAYPVELGAAGCGAGAAQPTNAKAVPPRSATVSNLGLKIRHHTDDLGEGSAACILFAHHHSRGDGAILQVTKAAGNVLPSPSRPRQARRCRCAVAMALRAVTRSRRRPEHPAIGRSWRRPAGGSSRDSRPRSPRGRTSHFRMGQPALACVSTCQAYINVMSHAET